MEQNIEGVVMKINKITTENSVSNVNDSHQALATARKKMYEHGEEWQSYISDRFEELGIQPKFFKVKDPLGMRIADFQYEGKWIEAKTFINNAEVAKIKTLNEELIKLGIQMIIMCEWEPGCKKYKKDVNLLKNLGIWVIEGPSFCESFIIDESVRLVVDKFIKMDRPISIPFEQLVAHPNNREKNSKNIPIIKASIVQNGFFTQINVVEHEMKEINGEMVMTYMIFEGHTRYYALLDLYEKGYNVPPVTCVLVDWVTSKNIDILHKMLITTNTTYSGWKLKNYITSHKGNLEQLGDADGVFSYGKILQACNQSKKQKWGEANPIYLFCHTNSLAFDDMKKVKDGTYRISEADYKIQIVPILEMMNQITSKDAKGKPRVYNGTIIRDIIVDVRVMYNTNSLIRENFNQFLGYLKLKFISAYDSGQTVKIPTGNFPNTKEKGQAFWDVIKSEYFGLKSLGMMPVSVQPYEPAKTIENFA